MSEDELLDEVLKLAALHELWWFHAHDSRRSLRVQPGKDDEYQRTQAGKGWVDLVLVGDNGTLFVELKSEDGRRSRAQIRWADRIVRAGLAYRLWRPDDLKDGTIAQQLEAIR